MNEITWHRYESVTVDEDAEVVIAAGYSNFYGEYNHVTDVENIATGTYTFGTIQDQATSEDASISYERLGASHEDDMVSIVHAYPLRNYGFETASYFMLDFGVPTQIMDLTALQFYSDSDVNSFSNTITGQSDYTHNTQTHLLAALWS